MSGKECRRPVWRIIISIFSCSVGGRVMPYIETSSGIRLYYESYGQGRPVIFVHPPLTGLAVFKYQKALSEHYRVILYDLRGHGKSGYLPSTGADRVVADHLDDLSALMDGLQLKKPILAGYSNGGILALAYTLKHKKKVGGLILSGGYPKVDSPLLAAEYKIGVMMMYFRQKRLLSVFLSRMQKVTQADQKLLSDWAMKTNTQAALDLYRSGLRFDAVNRLHELNDMPILILYGTWDKFINKHRKYFEKLQNAEIVYINKAFHQLPTHHHDIFNQVIIKFLTALSLRRVP
ncbi:alpha/beta hydrolase [Sporolactobacillus sp. THM7-7]|nr:alpha/beta hydrolase [Sporolactobacillus sp. THM7-7]